MSIDLPCTCLEADHHGPSLSDPASKGRLVRINTAAIAYATSWTDMWMRFPNKILLYETK